MFKMNRVKKNIATKPYYKKYNYRIRAKQLNNFYEPYLEVALSPREEFHTRMRKFGWNAEYTINKYPRSKEELVQRIKIADEIKLLEIQNKGQIKNRIDGAHTMLYVTSKELYDQILAVEGIQAYLLEVCEPAFENYEEVASKLSVTEEVRKCLYYEKHRYKITLVAGNRAELEDVLQFREMAKSVSDVYISPNLEQVHNYRYWKYTTLAVSCDHEDTASYLAMIGGDMVTSVKRAVLVDELK